MTDYLPATAHAKGTLGPGASLSLEFAPHHEGPLHLAASGLHWVPIDELGAHAPGARPDPRPRPTPNSLRLSLLRDGIAVERREDRQPRPEDPGTRHQQGHRLRRHRGQDRRNRSAGTAQAAVRGDRRATVPGRLSALGPSRQTAKERTMSRLAISGPSSTIRRI